MPDTPRQPNSIRPYAAFFWPLSFLGVAMLSGRLAQNHVLMNYRDGVQELAWFALALAMIGPFQSVLGMVPHMVTVMGRDSRCRRTCLYFVLLAAGGLLAPLTTIAWFPFGPAVVQSVYDVSDPAAGTIVSYLRVLSPLILTAAVRQWTVGVLVARGRTGWVTGIRVLDLTLLVALLAVGVHCGCPPLTVIALPRAVTEVSGLAISALVLWRGPRNADLPTHTAHHAPTPDLTYRCLFAYFWPLAFTTFMFTLSRPIIFAFVTNLERHDRSSPEATTVVAALSLAFTLGMVFQMTVNQFRHLLVRYGHIDPVGVRRFMVWVTVLVSAAMLLMVATPTAEAFFRHLQGARGSALRMALDSLWVLCLVPLVIACRNYYHGLAMVHHRTGSMALGGLARNGAILCCGGLFSVMGILDHRTAALLLVIAFAAEATTVFLATRSWVPGATSVEAGPVEGTAQSA